MIASSQNFSEMELPNGDPFDVGDKGSSANTMYSVVEADASLLTLLCGMNDRDKIILLYQVLRESGYNLNHAECAKTLNITREHYMVILRGVRDRAAKILQIPM